MSAAILTLVGTAFVGGLALLAQWARKNRQAEITLWTTLLGLSVLSAGVGAVTGAGLLLTAVGGPESSDLAAFIAAGAGAVAAGLAGLGLCVPPLLKITGYRSNNPFWADPPVFLALWLVVVLLANNAVSFLIFTQEPDVSRLFPSGRLSPGTVATSQLPFVAVALAGVGLGIRRNFRETMARLGYGPISTRHLAIATAFIAGALALSAAADALFAGLQPELYARVGELSDSLFNPRGLNPISAALFALLVGFGAALGEETLFRGALQPVLGITLTSILFASLHVQYGPSVLLIFVFLLSVGLGILRRRVNTTASFLAHAGYNSLGILIAYFFGG